MNWLVLYSHTLSAKLWFFDFNSKYLNSFILADTNITLHSIVDLQIKIKFEFHRGISNFIRIFNLGLLNFFSSSNFKVSACS